MLEITDVSKSFNQNIRVDQVSLKLKEGEIFGLLGPNGAGKTTLIRMINKILEADKGHLRFKGDLLQQKHLDNIGYLPEERGLYKSMTVERHAIFLGQLRGMTKKDAATALNYWLEKFQISDWRKRKIQELSKGMAQKVQFICAVLHEPDLLILDEPFSGFDPLNVELIKTELLQMKLKGKCILISTHNMRSVEEICDRIALIHKGKKILEGKVVDLQNSRKTGEVRVRFRGNMVSFVTALWTDFELVDKEILGDDLFTARVKLRNDAKIETLLKSLIGQVKIESVAEILPSMSDIFIEETSKTQDL